MSPTLLKGVKLGGKHRLNRKNTVSRRDEKMTWLKYYLDMVRFDREELQVTVKVFFYAPWIGQTFILEFRTRFLSGTHFRTLSSSRT